MKGYVPAGNPNTLPQAHPAPAGSSDAKPPAAAAPVLDAKMARVRRLNAIREMIGATSYLEIGVYAGATFFAIDVARKVAVDAKLRFDRSEHADPRASFFEMTSNDYFLGPGIGERFDLIFLDGLHTFEQTLIDFNASLLLSHGLPSACCGGSRTRARHR